MVVEYGEEDFGYAATSKFLDYLRKCENEINVKEFQKKWRKTFVKICVQRYFFDKRNANSFFENLTMKNWEHFHVTEFEKKCSVEYWMQTFYYDVLYCSDRWSLDRLMRCHWMFLRIMDVVKFFETYHFDYNWRQSFFD